MSFNRPHVIIKDNNGNYFLAGIEHGMDVSGGTIVTGGAMGDLSGYTLTLTGMEKAPANFMESDPASVRKLGEIRIYFRDLDSSVSRKKIQS